MSTPRFAASFLFVAAAVAMAGPPQTAKAPVTDTFYGVQVSEDYRWLEDADDPKVVRWSDTQNTYARGILDKLPHVDEIRARVTEIPREYC